MANKTEYARAAAPILGEILRSWCAVVKHSARSELMKISDASLNDLHTCIGGTLFPDINGTGNDGKKRFERWDTNENLPSVANLKKAARHAISSKWIPQNLSDSILNAYANFSEGLRHGVDFFELENVVILFECYTMKVGKPQHLVDQGKALHNLMYGPDDENSQEFKNWLALFKPFFLVCEKQNLDDFIELKLTLDVANAYEDFGGDSGSLDFTGISAGIKGLRALLPNDLGMIAQQIKSDAADLISSISIKTGLTPSQIAVLSGQLKSLGEFLAAGEIIPRPSAYRAMEHMAMLAETGKFDAWIECYKVEKSCRLEQI